MEIFKIIGIGLLTSIIATLIKQIRPEFYIVVILSGSVVMLMMIVSQLQTLFNYFLSIFGQTGLDYELFASILKILGVGYLTEFASGICVDSGNASIADKILLAGKVLIVVLSLPIITSLLNVIIEILP
ncbi:MAG: stage III sporulation protein AD [Clostridia bacterium]|nr:stage III sporulation protein AD [Clostridia bacterium]